MTPQSTGDRRARAAAALGDDGLVTSLAGREAEAGRLRALLTKTAGGRGAAVLVEGEPGIGKSALLNAALAGAGELGCHVAWAVADESDQSARTPVVARALGLTGVEAHPSEAWRILAYVRDACASAPLVLVVDGFQWVGETDVLMCERLIAATRRLPLLVVIASRRQPRGRELTPLRRAVRARHGHVLSLGPLPAEAVADMITVAAGAPPGPNVAEVARSAGGNPYVVQQVINSLIRRNAMRIIDGRADIDPAAPVRMPQSVRTAARAAVDHLGDSTRETLRVASLLGMSFAVDDLVALTGRTPLGLMADLAEAMAADVVVDTGTELAFRDTFLHRAVYESIPDEIRAASHRRTAEVLARLGRADTRVLEQLVATAPEVTEWVVSWLAGHHAEVSRHHPRETSELMRHVLATAVPTEQQRRSLRTALSRLDFRNERWSTDS
ncbi:AAA family ATPase [Actinoplanes sp. NPDC048796]|uniref:AAA family ATPase n=1 Tax=Actinoplanes sp. NPDC048796 TaxID=3155640 RepID=UPI0033FA41AE